MCVGTALTGGTLTLAATLLTHPAAEAIRHGHPNAFMHGPTYLGNPLACAAGLASLQLFESSDYGAKVARISRELRAGLAPALTLSNVVDVRALGAVGIIEVRQLPLAPALRQVILDTGVWLRPFGNFIYTMPPLISDTATIGKICEALCVAAALPPGPTLPCAPFHE